MNLWGYLMCCKGSGEKQSLLVSDQSIRMDAHAVSEGKTCLGNAAQYFLGGERRGFREPVTTPSLASTGKVPLHSGYRVHDQKGPFLPGR